MFTARLMQDSGVTGPSCGITAETLNDAAREARLWSLSQTGHPWDTLTLTDEDSNDGYQLQLSSHGAGRSSIQIINSNGNIVSDINV